MSYTITKTNGTSLGTILDGTINTSFTSLTLIGRNYANYGELIANDLVALVENFAYSTSPANPLAGQLWWNTTDKRLRVYTGSAFKIVSSCTAQTSAPSTTVAGDLWWDTTNSQLYIYNGTDPYDAAGWVLVGPQRNGSGAIWEQITDTSAIVHDVLSIKLDNARTSIISRDSEFTPTNAIVGYTTIKAGINANTSIGTATFWGLANNSSYLGGQPAASYLRNDIDATTTGTLTIAKNGGLTVGLSSNLQVTTTTAGNVDVRNTKTGGDLNFYANVAGTDTLVLSLDAAAGTSRVLTLTTTGALTVGGTTSLTGALAAASTGTFTGNLYAPTQGAGTSDTTVATTEFVTSGLSGLYPYKIYNGTTHVWAAASSINVVVSGTTVATASDSGFNLSNGATAITQPDTYSGAGNARVATTQFVKTASTWWGNASHRSAKWVSTAAPDAGVNDIGSNNGDFWFQREA